MPSMRGRAPRWLPLQYRIHRRPDYYDAAEYVDYPVILSPGCCLL